MVEDVEFDEGKIGLTIQGGLDETNVRVLSLHTYIPRTQ